MGLNVSKLPNYTNQNSLRLVIAAVTEPVTAARVKNAKGIMPNVKSAEAINILDTDVVFQAGGCGWTPSGTTIITQRKMETGKIKVQEALCLDDLEAKYTQHMLPAGQDYSEAEFAQEYVDAKVTGIALANEVAIWQGDKTSGNGNLNKFDGMLLQLDADPTVINANIRKGAGTISTSTGNTTVTGVGSSFTTDLVVGDKLYNGTTLLGTIATVTNDTSATLAANGAATTSGVAFNVVSKDSPFFAAPITADITEANVDAIMTGIYKAIPEAVVGNIAAPPIAYIGIDVARAIKIAFKNGDYFHYDASMLPLTPFMYPGLDIECQPTPGLSKTGRIVVAQDANLRIGTDLEGEEGQVKFRYDDTNEESRFSAKFRLGANYAIGRQITQYRKMV
jgi:hypothetical protein